MKICLIVINYNGQRFLPLYLPGLAESCARNDIFLLVTDDQSKDDSIAYINAVQSRYTINKGENHGFAANVNNGIRYANSIGTFDYFIISNNDIEISGHLFPVLREAIGVIQKKDPLHGLIGFKEVFENDRSYFDQFNYRQYNEQLLEQVKEIPGFFFVIRRELVEKIGYLDEEYFMYGEDNDYYTRTTKAGFTIYNTGLPVMHYSEGSSSNDKLTSWYVYRNAILFARKNLGAWGTVKMILSLLNQVYNPFYHPKNPGNHRVTRNGFFYNNYLLAKSIVWNMRHPLHHHKSQKK